MRKIGRILVPTDFSERSLEALRYARSLVASLLGSEIVLVHVMEPPIYPSLPFSGSASLPTLHEQLRAAASERLERVLQEELPPGMPARAVMRDGTPHVEIVRLAEEERIDLVVIATQGHSGLQHLLLGSTAERVIRTAPCPVLTVREKRGTAANRA